MQDQYEKAVYSPVDIQKMLGIGKNQAYELIKRGEFKYIQVGRRIVVPKWSFDEWFNK